jgi:large subunit ribosomal protein L24
MSVAHVRKKDNVVVVTGREAGKRGEVIRVMPRKGRVFVSKVNMVKRHTKPTQKHPQGGIIEKEGALHLSNVRLVCPKCDKGVRVRVQTLEDGSKQRACSRCGEQLGSV